MFKSNAEMRKNMKINKLIIIVICVLLASVTIKLVKKDRVDIKVEMDLHEWMPDKTFQYKSFQECKELSYDFNERMGVYPIGEETKRWESLYSLRTRVRNVADKYAHYDKVIFVCHGMVMRTLTYAEGIKPGEIIECKYEIGQPDCIYSFA